MKNTIYTLLLLLVFTQQLVAQSFQTGKYYTSSQAISAINLVLRDDNTIKADFQTNRGNYNYIFNPLAKNKGSYESTKGGFILTSVKDVLTRQG
uniref:hypothetical protein n=1 Tax=Aquimarina sp. Aq78 TaxID=1191889 RepID=UPI00131AF855